MAFVAPKEPGYPRPLAPRPLQVSLVPAYNQCTSAQPHARPAGLPGLEPRRLLQPARPELGPAHGRHLRRQRRQRANSIGSARMSVIDRQRRHHGRRGRRALQALAHRRALQAGARLGLQAALTDYTGQLQMQSVLRIIDRYNGPSEVGVGQDTPVQRDRPLRGHRLDRDRLQLLGRHDRRRGRWPGVVKETRRSIWQSARCRCSTAAPTAWYQRTRTRCSPRRASSSRKESREEERHENAHGAPCAGRSARRLRRARAAGGRHWPRGPG